MCTYAKKQTTVIDIIIVMRICVYAAVSSVWTAAPRLFPIQKVCGPQARKSKCRYRSDAIGDTNYV